MRETQRKRIKEREIEIEIERDRDRDREREGKGRITLYTQYTKDFFMYLLIDYALFR